MASVAEELRTTRLLLIIAVRRLERLDSSVPMAVLDETLSAWGIDPTEVAAIERLFVKTPRPTS